MTVGWLALVIQASALVVFLYRARYKQGLSPDGRHYLGMVVCGAPAPFARRWLLPLLLGDCHDHWRFASGIAFLAVGPLTYALTSSLTCVWLMAWLPGLAISVRLPVLTDQVAFTLMLLAVVLEQQGYTPMACVVLMLAAQAKEPAGMFGAVLCWTSPWAAGAGLLGTACAVLVGKVRGSEAHDEYLLHPFKVALTKHDPLDWVTMLLPWGGVAMVGMAAWRGMGELELVAAVSLAMGYGQLLIANDEARLFVWAAPAVLIAIAGYDGAMLVPALVLHPFLCGMAKRA